MVPFWLSSLMRLLKVQKKMNTKNLSLSQTQPQILALKYIIKLTMIAQDLVLLYLEISPKGLGDDIVGNSRIPKDKSRIP